MDRLLRSVKSRVADQASLSHGEASIARSTPDLETPEFFPLGLSRLPQECIMA